MSWKKIILNSFQRQADELEKVLDGLVDEELNYRPAPNGNSIGWLAWHVIRVIDRNMSALMAEEQSWIKDRWYARFGRAADPDETGMGHTPEQAKNFKSPPVKDIIGYQQAVLSRVENYINHKLTAKELARKVYWPTHGQVSKVEDIIVGQLWSSMHHVGQAGYIRGLLKGRVWYGR
jgi:hypothetical protein